MGTLDKIEEYLESLEERIFSAWSDADLPNVREALNSLWLDITRYGPGMPNFPQVHLPGLGDFEVPPPPPPPPSPPSLYERAVDWVEQHPYTTAGIGVGSVGAALLVGYGGVYMRTLRARRLKAMSTERRQVVVVLGGDSLLALPLILDLEKKGYLVVASVSTPDAVATLEHKCRGYVRALVLDPGAPDTIPFFLRSLASTLSRKFPINSAGDPFVSPASIPYIHSIISLLTVPSQPIQVPLEHISLQADYVPYLTRTQVTPLAVIQNLLPMLRSSPSNGKKSIIVCLPATPVRVGLPFDSAQAMSAAGTLRAAEVLRREINVAAMTGKSESMKNIRVVVVEVGTFNVATHLNPEDVYKAMERWSTSEKLTYGPAFAAVSQQAPPKTRWAEIWSSDGTYGVPRKPTDIKVFVNSVVGVVGNGRFGPSIWGINLGFGFIRNWLRGDRFVVGAGSSTYKIASYLPSLLLDVLLRLPHFLISLRNALLPTQPYLRPGRPTRTVPAPAPQEKSLTTVSSNGASEQEESSNNELSEAGSEADVESNNSGAEGTGVESSWISLKKADDTGV